MHMLMRRKAWAAAVVAVALAVSIGTAYAHEGREVDDYRVVVGFAVEPAYEGSANGVEVRVTRVSDHGEESGDHHGESDAVEGLEGTLQVEITHVSTGASRVLRLRADSYEPGRYIADLIPTVPGVYQFRLFGTIEGNRVGETFISKGRRRQLRRHRAGDRAPLPGDAAGAEGAGGRGEGSDERRSAGAGRRAGGVGGRRRLGRPVAHRGDSARRGGRPPRRRRPYHGSPSFQEKRPVGAVREPPLLIG